MKHWQDLTYKTIPAKGAVKSYIWSVNYSLKPNVHSLPEQKLQFPR